jgi:hypothetical protein
MTGRNWILTATAAVAGFLVGAFASGIGTVLAQERGAPAARQITAERFVVADASGNKRAEMGLDPQGRVNLTLYSEKGRVLWSAPIAGVMPLSSTQ